MEAQAAVHEVKDSKAKKQSMEEMELEFKRLEIEAKKLELLDIKERVDERQMKRDDKTSRTRANGAILDGNYAQRRQVQAQCNHKKGGNGIEGFVGGQGDDPQYAIWKHQFLNSDIWVRCLRCGKWWKPPVKENFYFDERGREVAPQDGQFNAELFAKAEVEYRQALGFPTRNSMSTSYQFRFSDGGEIFRKVTKDTDRT
jgi:hypothetical protein